MSKRDPRLYLAEMLESIARVERYVAGLSYPQFEASEMVTDAVVRNLEIVGEAARYIPTALRERYTQVEWSRVVGFRNIVIHAYFAVDVEIVWMIATAPTRAEGCARSHASRPGLAGRWVTDGVHSIAATVVPW